MYAGAERWKSGGMTDKVLIGCCGEKDGGGEGF